MINRDEYRKPATQVRRPLNPHMYELKRAVDIAFRKLKFVSMGIGASNTSRGGPRFVGEGLRIDVVWRCQSYR